VQKTISKLVRSWVPTLCLCYAFSATTLRAYRYHETFGAGNYYLDVYFDVNPRGYFQTGLAEQKIRFDGFFIKGAAEERVSGYFVKRKGIPQYQFTTTQGHFEGKLQPQKARCEPVMNFQVRNRDRELDSGAMSAGFCAY